MMHALLLKERDLVSKSGSFCTQTMQPLAHRTKKTTKYFRTKAFKKKSKTIILLPLKKKRREKEGELSGRFIS